MRMQRSLRRIVMAIVAFGLSLVVRLWARSCRVKVICDPRPQLRLQGRPYVYALLHEHQVAAVLANDEPRMAAMVSRSDDGDLLVPSLRARGVLAARGSGGGRAGRKGAETALRQLIALNRGGVPVLLAVDGPRGPRGVVHGGVVTLARATGAMILPVAVVAKRALILGRTWDRTQVPFVGTTLHLVFASPIALTPQSQVAEVQQRIACALQDLRATGQHS